MRTASWVVREKSSGKVMFETYSAKLVAALNIDKYEAVPIKEYLASINRSIKANAREA